MFKSKPKLNNSLMDLTVGGVADAPVITTLTPNAGPIAGGTVVVINGSGFIDTSSVTFGSTLVKFTVNSDSLITTTTPENPLGPVDVGVTTPNGTALMPYTYAAIPTITGITPTSGPVAGGNTVTINGSGFTTVSRVTFGNNSATIISSNDSQITVRVPARTAGTVNIVLTTAGGIATSVNAYTYIALPIITTLTPNAGPLAGGNNVTIRGSGFTGATNVTFGNTPATSFVVNSSSQISATVPARTAGTVNVVVTTVGGNSAPNLYTYAPIPVITTLTPNAGPLAGGNNVTIRGSGFTGATNVTFGNTPATSFVVNSSSQISATVPVGTAGPSNVIVTTPGGTSAAGIYTYAPIPIITALSPSIGPITGGNRVTISGSGFIGTLAVIFGSNPATSVVINNDNQITATAPLAGAASQVTLVIRTPGGTAIASTLYTYAPIPMINNLVPSVGPIAGGNTVTINGNGFTAASQVMFGGISVEILSGDDNQISVAAPTHEVGSVDVSVTTPGGTSLASSYTYAPVPTITTIDPSAGPIAGGNMVIINGSGFTTALSVTFGANSADLTVKNDGQIISSAPMGTVGTVDVVVTTLGGMVTALSAYTYASIPVITSLTPTIGPVTGGNTVTINGSGFADVSSVTFSGNYATNISGDDGQIILTVPPGVVGLADVVITTVGGSETVAGGYTYAPVPVINNINPSAGPLAGGNTVTISGSGFTADSSVMFGNIPVSNLIVDSDSQITVTVPPGTLVGPINVLVKTPGGTSSARTYTYAAVPIIIGIDPSAGPLAGGNTVTINGSGFTADSSVMFGNTPVSNLIVDSDSQITVTVPPGTTLSPVEVSVTTPGGTVTLPNSYTYAPIPVINNLEPSAGPLAGGNTVAINGNGFAGATSVTIGGNIAYFTVDSDGRIILAAVPEGMVLGPVDIVITTPGGTVTLANGYTYAPVPVITALDPNSGPLVGGNTVTINGSGFTPDSSVTFDGNPANVTFISDGQISVTAPPGAVGPVDVAVTTPGGIAMAPIPYIYAPVPVITALDPNAGPLVGGNTVTISGSGFTPDSLVMFGNNPANVTFISDGQISATVPQGAVGPADVTLTTPGGIAMAPIPYIYAPVPVITALDPNSGPLVGGNTVTISGSGFTPGSLVMFGNNPANVTFISDGQISATVPQGAVGPVDVTLTTPGGIAMAPIPYIYAPVPVITALDPNSGPLVGGNTVTISGSGFTPDSLVMFGNNPANVTFISDGQISATVPQGAVGPVDVTLTTPGGIAMAAIPYIYAPVPVIAALDPNSGPLVGGNTVTISGSGFTPDSLVMFGNNPANVTFISDGQISATVPQGAVGPVDVTLTTPGGIAMAPIPYIYAPVPVITALDPNSGPLVGGNTMTISGSGFTNASKVTFGGQSVNFGFNSNGQIILLVPSGTVGPVEIMVTTPGGTSAPSVYTYAPVPVITTLAPSAGSLAGGNTVTIYGSGFTNASSVMFGNNSAVEYTINSDSQITVTAPPGTAAGTVEVLVTTLGGTSAPSVYIYAPVPVITTLAPSAGSLAGGNTVTIYGSGFTNASSVMFGNNSAVEYTINSDSQITVTVPPGTAAGTVEVLVTTLGGTSAPSVYTYAPVPVITTLDPSVGSVAGGNTVTISGSGFTTDSLVTFGGKSAAIISSNDGQITVTVPPGTAAGTVEVLVTTPGGRSAPSSYTYTASSSITNICPNIGSVTGGNTVIISGSGFNSASRITFGGTPVEFTVNSDNQITATAPAGALGPVEVAVTTASDTAIAPSLYTYTAVPVVTNICANIGPVTGGNTVKISGSGFTDASNVMFGNNPAVTFTVNSDSQITATAPAGALGSVEVAVTTPGGTVAAPSPYTYTAVPMVTNICANTGPVAGGNTVTISGSGFTKTSRVMFGSNSATFTINSDGQISATVPAGTQGPVNVVVKTPGGTSTALSPYTYATTAVPVITNIDPNTGPLLAGNTVTINGSGFTGASNVMFGNNPATILIGGNDSQISVRVPPGTLVGTVNVVITTPNGTSAPSPYTYAPVPVINNLGPSEGPLGGGNTVTISGSGFTPDSRVMFGNNPANVTFISDSQITATVPAGTALGPVPVVVTTSGGPSAASTYTYATTAVPVITNIDPNAGPLLGGNTVTINGSGFTGASNVMFGNNPATILIGGNDSQISVRVPPGTLVGTVNVVITTPNGTSAPSPYTYAPVPVINNLGPSEGPLGGGNTVTISGSGFTPDSRVMFGNNPANVTFISDSQITATVPAGTALGPVPVVVTTSGGPSAASTYTYATVPGITTLDPNAGPLLGGNTVTINGSGFTGASNVMFGNNPATILIGGNDSQISVRVPPGTLVGTVNVVITTPNGTSAPSPYTYAPVPVINNLGPSEGPLGGGNTVTISGSGFTPDSRVMFGNNPANVTFISDSQITATVPAGTALGPVPVVVTTSGGPSAASTYTYATVPGITTLDPNAGPLLGGNTVTINGSGFTGASNVMFGNNPATILIGGNDSQISVRVPPGTLVGTVNVVITTPNGTSAPSPYTYAPVPVINNLGPSEGPLGGGNTVTISGSGFTPDSRVMFGNNPANVTFISDSQITATVPAGTALGPVPVVVTTSGGPSAASTYTYATVPGITTLDPNAGPLLGGNTVTINGSGFTGASNVMFGNNPATILIGGNDSQISVRVPPGTLVGTVNVVITTPNGTSAPSPYTYAPVPVINNLGPSEGPLGGGNTVTISGSGFTPDSRVMFGNNPANVTFISDSQITATVPAGTALGPVPVVVTTSGGPSAASTYTYATTAVPVITNIDPNAGPLLGGNTVTINGSGFTGASNVMFGNNPATILIGGNDSQISVRVPPGTLVGTVNVVITTPNGTSAPSPYTYAPVPVINNLGPSEGPLGGGNTVTISGSGFTPDSRVMFGNNPANVTFISDSQITATVPAGTALGPVPVVVTTSGGPSAAIPYRYAAVSVITTLVPNAGSVDGGNTVTINGSGFTGASSVMFGGTAATTFTINSDSQITATAPAGTIGTAGVVVTTPGGISVPSPYTYTALPAITAINLNTGPVFGGNTVTINGHGFTDAYSITFGGTLATFTVNSDSQITVTVPAGPLTLVDLPVDVVITMLNGAATAPSAYTYSPIPVVTTLNPIAGSAAGGNTVTIKGHGFINTTGVTFGGTGVTKFTVDNDQQISATVPTGTLGAASVVVSKGLLSGTAPNPYTYTVSPGIITLNLTTGTVAGGNTVTINGRGFTGASRVMFGSEPAIFTVNSDSQITATAPAGTLGAVDVEVTTPNGIATASSAYIYSDIPAIATLNLNTGPVGGGNTVTINGSRFTSASKVTFNGNPATFTVDSDNQITAKVPAGPIIAFNNIAVDVVVTTPVGTATALNFYTYTVLPGITTLVPTAGSIAGGNTVTINGSGFIGTTGVTFGGTGVTKFTVDNDQQISATVPAHAVGSASVVVQKGLLVSATAPSPYTYNLVPGIATLAPAAGPVAGGNAVIINGGGFTSASRVMFGGTAATAFTINSDSQITATAPAGIVGSVNIAVTTPNGTSAPSAYMYQAVPVITTLNLNTGPLVGGNTVTINGSGFTNTSRVMFADNSATFTVDSDSQITTTVPLGGLIGFENFSVDVKVTTPGGTTTASNFYTYAPIPEITTLNPAAAPVAGGNIVKIGGLGFTNASGVSFGGTGAINFTVDNDQQISATVPARAALGPVDVVVSKGLASATAHIPYTYIALPTIITLDPIVGPVAGGNNLTINGRGFIGAFRVMFGNNSATFTINSDSKITAKVPTGVVGPVDVMVTTQNGTAITSSAYIYSAVPAITTLNPSTGPLVGGNTVVINGHGFITATGVSFGGSEADFTVDSDQQITAKVPGGPLFLPGNPTVDVVVVTPGGTATASNFYTYAPIPVITALAPTKGSVAGGDTVKISGLGFTNASGVSFGDSGAIGAVFTVNSDNQIIATAPAHAVGQASVVVSKGLSYAAAPIPYTYTAVPGITTLSPSAGPVTGGNAVIINGGGFTNASRVMFGATAATTFTINSARKITATAPSGTVGSVNIAVTTSNGTSAPSPYLYTAIPVITTINPPTGPFSGGNTVMINGYGFTATSKVTINGNSATFTVNNDSQISVTVPGGPLFVPGNPIVDVAVTTPGGTVTAPKSYTYTPNPVITTINPTKGSVAGGNNVVINGVGFIGATGVSFGGSGAAFTVNSDSQITTTAPARAAGSASVVVNKGIFTAVTAPSPYLYIAIPVITTLSPATGPIAGGNVVTINGSGFSGASSVMFGGNSATNFTVNSDSQITATAPQGVLGSVTVIVTTINGATSSRYTYT